MALIAHFSQNWERGREERVADRAWEGVRMRTEEKVVKRVYLYSAKSIIN